MKIIQNSNLSFIGSNQRPTALDEIYSLDGANKPILLFAHGFKGFKDWGHFPLIARAFATAGFYVIKFNFSHNGGTVDEPIDFPDLKAFSINSYWKELQDIKNLLSWLTINSELKDRGADLSNLNLLGHSRGGGVSLIAAQQYALIKRVITWAAIHDFEERLPDENELNAWKKSGVRFIENGRTKQQMPMRYEFIEDLRANAELLKIKNAVKTLNKPQLIIHGTDDSTVPVTAAHQLKKWNPKAAIALIAAAQHTFDGQHPWTKKTLPRATKIAVEKTISFIKST